jgi:hypothetical protein
MLKEFAPGATDRVVMVGQPFEQEHSYFAIKKNQK